VSRGEGRGRGRNGFHLLVWRVIGAVRIMSW
jgi:hypothetical protein